MKKKFLLIFLLVFLPGCNSQTEVIESNNAYPITDETNPIYVVEDKGYPFQDGNQVNIFGNLDETIDFDKLLSDSESGIIVGKLVDTNGNPYIIDLYLARTIESGQKDYPYMLAYSPEESLKAKQAKDGRFIFEKVPPGIYGIIVSNPINDIALTEENKKELVFSIDKNEILNLGIIQID